VPRSNFAEAITSRNKVCRLASQNLNHHLAGIPDSLVFIFFAHWQAGDSATIAIIEKWFSSSRSIPNPFWVQGGRARNAVWQEIKDSVTLRETQVWNEISAFQGHMPCRVRETFNESTACAAPYILSGRLICCFFIISSISWTRIYVTQLTETACNIEQGGPRLNSATFPAT
jgi:hypothetical protein